MLPGGILFYPLLPMVALLYRIGLVSALLLATLLNLEGVLSFFSVFNSL